MDDFGVMISLKSKFDGHQMRLYGELLTFDRPAPMLKGEQGAELQKQVWSEIVDALTKDVPEVQSLVKA